jgi:D-alanyl-D-alanine carboxypeptidase/D-alanyl-D-alanine-endopeptidase (penicillin-binding protein 4)
VRRTPAILAAICALLAALFTAGPVSAATGEALCENLRSRLVHGGGSASGLLVLDADTGQTVCARAANRRRSLASNMKLFTTATALARVGPTTRIPTRVMSKGELDGRGILHGDLYLVGGGDPALGTPSFYDRYKAGVGTPLPALATRVWAAGIRVVTGRLYADDTIFDRLRGVADSGYATSPYIGPLSGLAFDSGYSGPSLSGFSSDPAKLAASTLAGILRKRGMRIRPRVALGKAPRGAARVAVVRSPEMTRLVDLTNVYSDNFFAEMLLKLLGARFGDGGTTAGGAAVVEAFASGHGSSVHAVDGSGLTRSNRASPAAVVHLLQSMRSTPVGEELIQDMALTGHEGTVDDRMRGTAAYGRCRTKTGTLTGVSNLSGYCFNRDGKTMIFSILMGSVSNLSLAHREQDRIAGAIAAY